MRAAMIYSPLRILWRHRWTVKAKTNTPSSRHQQDRTRAPQSQSDGGPGFWFLTGTHPPYGDGLNHVASTCDAGLLCGVYPVSFGPGGGIGQFHQKAPFIQDAYWLQT